MPHVSSFLEEQRPLRVLEGHRPPRSSVSYIDQIVGPNSEGIDFSFLTGPLREYHVDVVHLHHPCSIFGDHSQDLPDNDFLLSAMAHTIVWNLKRHHTALVQTVFGTTHCSDRHWCRILDRSTSTFIVLDAETPTPDSQRTVLIPHAHYRDRFLGYPQAEQIPGQILCLSPDRLMDVAEGPLKVFPLTDTAGLSVRLAGRTEPSLDALIAHTLLRTPQRVTTNLGILSDAEIVQEITAAELVLAPAAESLSDTSMLFFVLSLDRPVLIPESTHAKRLAEEVGPGWIHLHPGPISAALLDEVIQRVRTQPPTQRPNLVGRDFPSVAHRYAEVFRGAAEAATASQSGRRRFSA